MQINLGEEKILRLVSPFGEQEIADRARAKRMDAFGQLIRFVQRPKPDEIVVSQTEKRYEPFWYGAARAFYKYDRRHRYEVGVAPEVESVTVYEHDHAVDKEKGRHFALDAMEHCEEHLERQLMLDPFKGDEHDYARYLGFDKEQVADLEALRQGGAAVISPEVRSSFLVRKLAGTLMRTFQADKIYEERIDVDEVVLYYRPVYAFEYLWTGRDKRAVVEFDALTGDVRAEPGQIKKQVATVLENDALFDIGADVVGTVLPGANIVVKIGRLAARKALE